MLMEYADLVEQLKEFREGVIKALAEIEVELETLRQVVISNAPVDRESLKLLRAKAQNRLAKFQEHYGQQLAQLHEKR